MIERNDDVLSYDVAFTIIQSNDDELPGLSKLLARTSVRPLHFKPRSITKVGIFSGDVLESISFVVPAHNEEFALEKCLGSIVHSANSVGCEFELIVVDDDSTDRTAEIASEFTQQVISVSLRNIAAVRNAGAALAQNAIIVFVDADTELPVKTLRAILTSIDQGVAGGGAKVRFDRRLTPAWYLLVHAFILIWQDLFQYAAGCLVFVRREIFESIGGFDEQYLAAEEMYLSRAIKRYGKFRIVRASVITSARKMRTYRFWELFRIAFSALLRGPKAWRKKTHLSMLYDGRRESKETVSK